MLAFDPPREKIHGGRTEEGRDERVGGSIVKLKRGPDLLDAAAVHHHDLVAHGHRLDLIVGDVDRRCFEPVLQLLDLATHLHAQLGVEVGQRFVEQEDLRIADNRPAHGDPLPLAAGKLSRVACEQRLKPE